MSREWNAVGNGFCENLLYGFPEYGNALSSWFISLIGLYGLFFSRVQSGGWRWLYGLYAWSGVGSFLFHWYGYRFYGQLDTVPLLIASWILVYESWKVVLEQIKQFWLRDKIIDLLCLFTTMSLVLTLSARSVDGRPWGMQVTFTKAFAIPQLLSCSTLLILWLQWRKNHQIDNSTAFRYVLIGFLLAAVSAIVWIATEPYCRQRDDGNELKYPAIPYLYTHVIWHIGIIWGAHMLIQVGIYFDYLNRGESVRFVTEGIWYKLFPLVEWRAN